MHLRMYCRPNLFSSKRRCLCLCIQGPVPNTLDVLCGWRAVINLIVTMDEQEPTPTEDALLQLLKLQHEQRKKVYDELLPTLVSAVYASVMVLLHSLDDDDEQERRRLLELKRPLRLHTQRSRGPRKNIFNHYEALYCIYRDFLGPIPKFPGDQFRHFFRISRERFVKLMQDIMSTNNPFYKDRRGASKY